MKLKFTKNSPLFKTGAGSRSAGGDAAPCDLNWFT